MALVLGTNAGFVTTAPTADPASGGNQTNVDTRSHAHLDISPSDAVKIIEIGWYINNATEEANFEVGLYSDAGNDEPETRLFVSDTNAKGTTAGWKTATVDWNISGSTNYWLATYLDNTAEGTDMDMETSGGNAALKFNQTTLLLDWGTSTAKNNRIYAIYALVETAVGFTRKIKISGTFQDKPIKTKVAGTFQDKPIKIKVGGTFQDA